MKKSGTTSISNYLGNCESIDEIDRAKYFEKGMKRYAELKKGRRDPKQSSLENFGIKVTSSKRFKRTDCISKERLDPSVRRLISEEIILTQLDIVNKDLQPPNLLNKD